MRRRYRWDAESKAMVEVPWDSHQQALSPVIWNDLPAYESPIDGRIVDGRKQRRNDLARSHCRPYEGREQEGKEAAKVRAEQDRQTDQLAERMAHVAWADAPESIRKMFRGR
jgi:hypothetical protein